MATYITSFQDPYPSLYCLYDISAVIYCQIYTLVYMIGTKKIIRKEISFSVNILNAVFKENEHNELLAQAGGVRGEDQRDVRREPGRRVPRPRQCCQEINKDSTFI